MKAHENLPTRRLSFHWYVQSKTNTVDIIMLNYHNSKKITIILLTNIKIANVLLFDSIANKANNLRRIFR